MVSSVMSPQAHSAMGGLDDGDLQVLQDNLEKLSQAFNIDEDQESAFWRILQSVVYI